MLLVPRVLLFPLYAVNEYLIRAPLGATMRWVERDYIIDKTIDTLTWRDRTIGIFPIVSLSNGQRPGFGFSAFADHPFVPWHFMTLATTTDFQRNVMTLFTNRFKLSETTSILWRANYEQRNDFLFYGYGPRTNKNDQTRFERRKPFTSLELISNADTYTRSRLGEDQGIDVVPVTQLSPAQRLLSGRIGIELSDNTFHCTTRTPDICKVPSRGIQRDTVIGPGRTGEAAFFEHGYSLLRVKALGSIDTRAPDNPQQTGIRFDAFGRYGKGLGDRASGVNFFRYGGELGLFLDVSGGLKRVIAARFHVEMLTSTSHHTPVPFEELIALGGPESMRGFLPSRFLGTSAAFGSLEYRYPIWSFLNATMFYDLGNVFGDYLRDFDVKLLRGSWGLAFRSNTSRDVSFQFLIGAGTKRWSVAPDEFRIAAGINVGF